jgi:hypothetical protein
VLNLTYSTSVGVYLMQVLNPEVGRNQTKVREKHVSILGWVVNFIKIPENQLKIYRNG